MPIGPKDNQRNRIEEFEGRLRFLESAVGLIIRHSRDGKLQAQINKLKMESASDERVSGWCQAKNRVQQFAQHEKIG
ncbi:MAG: hypothetical protein OXH06_01345 [Gemmatimonadetes bacterium]|nr:hypothetical protein [Gemmatimonadota bacterium]